MLRIGIILRISVMVKCLLLDVLNLINILIVIKLEFFWFFSWANLISFSGDKLVHIILKFIIFIDFTLMLFDSVILVIILLIMVSVSSVAWANCLNSDIGSTIVNIRLKIVYRVSKLHLIIVNLIREI